MVIDKIFVTNTTQLSLSDRFTILQSVRHTLPPARQWPDPFAFQNNVPPHTRNKKIMNRIGGTPVVQAALALKKIPLKQRIGKIGKLGPQRMPNARSLQSNHRYDMGSVLSPGRLGLSNGAREGLQRANSYSNLRMPRIRQRSRSRANSVGNLSRSNSWGNLSDADWPQYNGNPQRGRKNRGKGIFRYGGRSRGNWGRGGGGEGNNGGGRGAQGWGRGRGRGRGRGWNRSSNNQQPPPSKEALDLELEQYMAASRGFLDRELDSYMNTAMDTQ